MRREGVDIAHMADAVGTVSCSAFGWLIFLALWLREQFGFGDWVLWAGIVLGLLSALDGLRQSLKLLPQLTRKKSGDTPPPVSYNDHD